jgi:thioredoxin 1
VDECQETAQKCDVSAMPTFQVFVDGKKVAEMLGADVAALKAMVDKWKATE